MPEGLDQSQEAEVLAEAGPEGKPSESIGPVTTQPGQFGWEELEAQASIPPSGALAK